MATPHLCSEAEITAMVHAFYGKVRQDPVLAPIFAARITDWDHHLAKLVDFWSGLLRGTARFQGAPMQKHAGLPGLKAATFERWLVLFHQTTATLDNQAMRARADQIAERIAESLWYGYQLSNGPEGVLPLGLHTQPHPAASSVPV